MLQHVGAIFGVTPGAVIKVWQHHEITGGAKPARHVVQLLADPRRVHQHEHRWIGTTTLRPADKRLHLPVFGGYIYDLFAHRIFLHPTVA